MARTPAVNGLTQRERVVAYLQGKAGARQTIAMIAEGTGLAYGSVTTALRTLTHMLDPEVELVHTGPGEYMVPTVNGTVIGSGALTVTSGPSVTVPLLGSANGHREAATFRQIGTNLAGNPLAVDSHGSLWVCVPFDELT